MSEYKKFSKLKEVSIEELQVMDFPLMMSGLSWHLMTFLDRLILGRYSIEAMASGSYLGDVVWNISVCSYRGMWYCRIFSKAI